MRPSERLTCLFLAALAIAAVAGARRNDVALLYLAVGAAAVALSRTRLPEPAALVRDLFPIVVVLAVYLSLEPVIVGVNPRRWDGYFSGFDDRWLPGLVSAWRGVSGRHPRFTDASYLVYVSYYLLPIAAVLVARRRGEAWLERSAFAVLFCFYASFLGYLLFPTAGPRLPEAEEVRLGGGPVSEAVRAFLRHAGRTRLDAFPSGNTSAAVVSAAVAARAAPRAAPAFAAWAAAVIFTTVYVHVHYAVDVLAGLAVAAAVLLAAGPLSRAVGRAGRPAAR